jgi:HrpA-like RNA helicase
MIAVTQPRRVAAITVARRVAEELGVQLGREVRRQLTEDKQTLWQMTIPTHQVP